MDQLKDYSRTSLLLLNPSRHSATETTSCRLGNSIDRHEPAADTTVRPTGTIAWYDQSVEQKDPRH
jgi:hypothetical protein